MSRREKTNAPKIFSRALLLIGAFGGLFAFAAAAWARPGGGGTFHGSSSHSYSGSSHSSGGGGGGADFFIAIIWGLLELCVDNPPVGIPLTLGLIVLIVWAGTRKSHAPGADWSTAAPSEQAVTTRRALEKLRAADPDFSLVLFEDFLYALYAEVHTARGGNKLDRLLPWLTPFIRDELGRDAPDEVKDIVVGALHLRACTTAPDGTVAVQVEFETNLTEVARVGGAQSWYRRELWRLERKAGVRSRPPEKIRAFGCPNCGANLEAQKGNVCTYCQQPIDTGAFDWRVTSTLTLEREPHGPQLTADPPEVGTELPTVLDADLATNLAALTARDPEFAHEKFFERVKLIFAELQVAWSEREWLRARPFVSDRLFQMQLYWIEAYKKAHLKNLTDKARVTNLEIVRVTSDKHFDAVTVRLYATGLDYTVYDTNNNLVAGSRTRERAYTEYWTLIRGATVRGAPRADKRCPGCGADLKINMAGACEFCRARVTSGEFDWVLSQIEQDEAYSG